MKRIYYISCPLPRVEMDILPFKIAYSVEYRRETILTIYAPMIYTAPCVRFLMRGDTLRGEVGGGGVALETSSFVGPCEIA
jgi:hypothetical protein